jgi:hypothetical protein
MTSFLRRFSACDHGVTRHLSEAVSKRGAKIDQKRSFITLTSRQIESSKDSNAERI